MDEELFCHTIDKQSAQAKNTLNFTQEQRDRLGDESPTNKKCPSFSFVTFFLPSFFADWVCAEKSVKTMVRKTKKKAVDCKPISSEKEPPVERIEKNLLCCYW